MKRVLIAAGMIAVAAPVFAQTTAPTTSTPPTATPMPQSSAPSADNEVAAAPVAVTSDPKAIIASEFPSYDKDGNGSLAVGEFDTWMMALKEKSGDIAMKPADKTSWLKSAFTTADKDKSKGVTLVELTNYLTAAA